MPGSPRSPLRAMQTTRLDGSDAGVILLSASPRILHMNHRARLLLKVFGEAQESRRDLGTECLPSVLTEFCRDLLSEMERRNERRDSTHFELSRVCHMVTPPLLLRGFALSSATADRQTQMILTVQACASSINASSPD